ncbi:L-threonine O-3-phosphate decarboxylase [Kushneria sinocarnis]|uniref:Aminotransferase n=1 Tax=Kushneria sinocarnis TaxID=595502 RepID=A0A420WYJ4_9GAMM|nr:aminotransferase class I/II-fold pyridoxal phosphate-dependent enzyme [Kushneria sinocarnis]RKR06258.1 L-threonine O-3-phosphate decarboxylase [Kushneria sinocarnis]
MSNVFRIIPLTFGEGPPRHGGSRPRASEQSGGWLDLSTGVNPWHYPCRAEDLEALRTLPDEEEPLLAAARQYYLSEQAGADREVVEPMMVPGSQWAIEQLPHCFPPGRVALPIIGYREHGWCWHRKGHACVGYPADALEEVVDELAADSELRAVVVINPNNPTGDRYSPDVLRRVAGRLAEAGITLIIDEAFADAEPELSMTGQLPDNAMVLRSFGKFFGLPGLRLGAVLGRGAMMAELKARGGPWHVGALAQRIGARALADGEWQQGMRSRLERWSKAYARLLQQAFEPDPIQALAVTPLFVTITLSLDQAVARQEALRSQKVLVRLWPLDEQRGCLRFGLLREEDTPARQRLFNALELTRP